ncbi:MAG: phage major capsid protein [Nitrosomonadaceae bacterium]
MPFANADFDEIITTTLKNRSKKIARNIINNNGFLDYLKMRGNTQIEDGGETLVEALDFAENDTFKYYDGYETLDVSASNVLSSAQYDWKQAAVNVVLSGREIRQNSGSDTRVINLLAGKIQNCEDTFYNRIGADLYADGTGSGGKEIGGLQLLVADAPGTGTVGGIDRSAFTFWQNKFQDTTAATAANIQGFMNGLMLECTDGMKKPNLILADAKYYNFYWTSLQEIQRINTSHHGEAGYETLAYRGPHGKAEVIYDPNAPTNHMYFIETSCIKWRAHRDANFTPTEQKVAVNQDAIVRPMLLMANLTMSNARVQGVLFE